MERSACVKRFWPYARGACIHLWSGDGRPWWGLTSRLQRRKSCLAQMCAPLGHTNIRCTDLIANAIVGAIIAVYFAGIFNRSWLSRDLDRFAPDVPVTHRRSDIHPTSKHRQLLDSGSLLPERESRKDPRYNYSKQESSDLPERNRAIFNSVCTVSWSCMNEKQMA